MLRHAPLLALVFLAAAPAAAQDVRGVAHQELVLLLNPMGAQHDVAIGLRAPLFDQNELVFGGAHAEAGLVSRVSPVYANTGGYLEVSPFAFLVLRGEVLGVGQWPIGMDGAGYYALSGDDDDVRSQSLRAEAGDTATGWTVRLSGQLQGAIPFSDDVRLVLANRMTFQHDDIGAAPFYYAQEHDLVLARSDWVVHNDALALAEIRAASDILVRAGAYSDLRWVPRSGYVGHQVGPLAALSFERVSPEVSEISVFVRGGYYTHHVIRCDQLTVLAGLSIDYDLGPVR
ncbi:MAG: hypothetical protein KC619_17605 [Myxococcales bacterium]|nr:hypothetical protein [Myxococcales bacterium]